MLSRKLCIVFIGVVIMFNLILVAFASTTPIDSISYSNVGTTYSTAMQVMPNYSGGRLYVRTRPTSTSAAKMRIRKGATTLASGTFPYQTQAPYISASLEKNKLHSVQIKAESGTVSGVITGYAEK